jgi:2-oxo-3-hexenedioate decarboxylase
MPSLISASAHRPGTADFGSPLSVLAVSLSSPPARDKRVMTSPEAKPLVSEVAAEVITASSAGTQIQPFSSRYADFTFAEAYEVAQQVRDIRIANGETIVGRKIGFTNRAVWDSDGLSAPIWGYIYDSTVRDLSPVNACFPLTGLAEPRIEPEIVLGVAHAPDPDMSDEALLGCIEWVAHGFEIVQSIFPGWVFKPPDAVAAQGVHVALLIGERHPVFPHRQHWSEVLSKFRVDLLRDGEVMTHGQGHDVLGGPIQALRFLVRELARRPASEPLRPGEIVTTGTLTQAMPAVCGETWTTVLRGIDIGGLQVRFGMAAC